MFLAGSGFAQTYSTPGSLPGSGTDVTGVGTVTWTNVGNITGNDNIYATANLNGSTTHYLRATNFGFAIPTNATITGITVTIGRYGTTGSGSDVRDNVVSLINNGTVSGSNLAYTTTDWPSLEATANYGGTTNMWGFNTTTLTPAIINAANFGVALSVKSSNTRTAYVDYITISVSYNGGTYSSQVLSVNTGSVTWCAGETRTVTATIKNTGTFAWTDGPGGVPDFNVGIKWNTNGTSWNDYNVRTDAKNLAPGQTGTYSFTITASNNLAGVYTTPLTIGSNNLTFNVVYEGVMWFSTPYTSPAQTIVALPGTPSGASSQSFCSSSGPTIASLSPSGANINWYSSSSGGTVLATTTPLVNGTHYYASQTNGSGCESPTRLDVTASIYDPAIVTNNPTDQTKCAGQTASFSVMATGGPLTYQWQKNGSNISGATANYTTPALVPGDNNATYRVIVTSAGCGSVTSTAATLTVNTPASITTQPVSQSTCAGSPVTFSVATTGTPPLSYQWKKGGVDISGETNATYSIASVAAGDAASYTVAITNVCNSVTSTAATLNVGTAAAITTDPLSQTKCTGGSVTFNVAASGGPLTYQWRKNGSNISGANSSSFSIPTIVAGDAANYDVVVTSSACNSVTSAIAVLTVNVTPSITTPPATQTICLGNPVTFNVTANGTALTYQWKKGGVNISGETNPSFTIASVSASDAANYSVAVTNSCNSLTSANAALAVNTPASISTPPVDQTVCAGQSVTFSVNAAGTSPTYQWRKGGVNISGATSSSYTKTGVTTADAGSYDVVVSVNNCTSVTSSPAILTINTAPTITTQPAASQIICLGTSVTFSLTATGTPAPTYQWKKGEINISGATGSSYTIASVSAADAATYTVLVSNNCGSVTSSNAVLTTTTVGSWIGVTSTDWFTASNWGCGVIPTSTTDVTIPVSTPFMPNIIGGGAVCRNITNNGGLTISGTNNLDVYGDFINNGTFTANTSSSVTFRGGTGNTLAGTNATTFGNLVVNKAATANTITSTAKAFTTTNLNVTQGNLILQAVDANYTVKSDINVLAGGILTHSVNWDVPPPAIAYLLSVGGNINVDGLFNYTIRSHVQMYGVGKTVRTGNTAGSAFSIFTLVSGSTVTASGKVTINDNFWVSLDGSACTFTTDAYTIIANAALLMNNGTVNLNAGTLTLSGGMYMDQGGTPTVNLTSGILNADFVNVGNGAAVNGLFKQSGGTVNVGNVTISTSGTYTCTNSPIINITGNWTNSKTFTAATSQVNFVGTTAQTIGGTAVTTFNNLSINNAAGVTLANSENVNSTLDLTNGLVTTAANTITVNLAGNITNASANSYINGKLAQVFNTNISKVYPVGKGGNYRPVTFTYVSRSGTSTVTVEQIEGNIGTPTAPATAFTQRYWNISQSGGTNLNYKVTLNDPAYNPVGFAKILKQEGSGPINAFDAATPNYTNTGTPAFTTFNGTNNGTNSFALGSDCSSSANAGPAMAAICQGGKSAILGGSVSGTATGGTWTDGGIGGTFNPDANTVNATWTPPSGYFGTATLTLTPTGGICAPNSTASKTIVVNGDATIALSSASGTDNQTRCINTAISNIIYSIGGGATGASVSGLPNGVTGRYNSGTFTISGTPSQSGTFKYTVSTTGPCVKPTMTGTITVTADATITLTSAVGTNNQTVCSNVAITPITYSIGGTGTNATITGLPSGVTATVNSGVVTISGVPGVTGTFNYKVTTEGPCATPSLSGTIVSNSVPTGTFSSSATTICAGTSVTFSATSGYGSYIFKINSNTVQSGTSNTFSSPILNNGDKVTVDVANNNCATIFGPIIITVNPLPSATLSVSKNPICSGETVTFTATGGTNYTLKVNGLPVSSNTTGIFTTNTLKDNDKVTVDVTDGNSCMATSAEIVMVVNQLPVPTLTSTTSPAIICAGDNITFIADGGSSYNFKVNGTSVSGQTGGKTFSSTTLINPSVVTVDVINAAGCMATSDPIPVTVNDVPVVSITTTENSGSAPNDNKICAGGTVTFTATPGFTGYKFYLRGTGDPLASVGNVYTTNSLVDGDFVTVIATTSKGCSNPIPASSGVINVAAAPSGSLISSAPTSATTAAICAGDKITFTAAPGFKNYNFKVGATTVQNGSGNVYETTSLANGQVVSVEVMNDNGCVATFNTITVTVNALPAGNLSISETSGLINNDGIICAGAPVTFTAPTGFSNYNFLLNGATIQNTASNNVYTTTTLANGDKVSVAVTNGSGCMAILTPVYTITVNTLPSVAAISVPSGVCVGKSIAVKDITAGGTWSSLNPSIATIDASGNVTGVSAGKATINYTVTNSNGCVTTVSADVTVFALPVVPAITGNVSVCVNSTITLSNTTAGGTWSSDNTSVATIDDVSGLVTGKASGTANISYVVANSNGCITTVNKQITVNPLPVVTPITTTAPSSEVCVGADINLSSSPGGGVWSSSNPLAATVNQSGKLTGVADGTTTISYVVTDLNGCSNVPVTHVVTVHDLPEPSLDGPNPICPGAVDVYTTEDGQSNYLWSVTGGSISGGSSNNNTITVTWNLTGPYSIHVNYTNPSGCYGATSATVTANNGTPPKIAGDPAVCVNENGSYHVAPGQKTYFWTADGGIIAGGDTNSPTITWATPGTKTVTANFEDQHGCIAAKPDILNVTVNPLPIITTHQQSVCSPATVDLTLPAVTSGSTTGLTYTYWMDAAATVAVTNPKSVGAGTYYIKGITSSGCIAIESVKVIVNPSPTVSITNPAAVCSPATVDLTANAITNGSTDGLSFNYWTNAGATSAYITPATASAGTYYIKGTTAEGCIDIKPVFVTVNPTPVVTTHNPPAVCFPAIVDLTAASVTSGSSGVQMFSYFTDAAGTVTLSNPNTVSVSGSYYIKGTSNAGCSDIKPVIVTINDKPLVKITDPAAVCSPATVNVTSTGVTNGSTNGLTFTYFTDATGTTTLVNPNAVSVSGTYYIKGMVSATGCYDIQPVKVTINPLPSLVITDPAAVCSPSTINLTASSVTSGSTGVSSLAYYTNAAGTSVLSNPNVVAASGTYYIKGTSSAGCSDAIKPVTVTINPLPTATISGTTGVCQNAPQPVITFTGANGTAPYTFTYTVSGTGGNQTITSLGNTATVSVSTNNVGTITYTLISIKDASSTGCSRNQGGSAVVTVNAPPAPFLIDPASASMCLGSVQSLTAGGNTSTSGSPTFNSTINNVAIPDNSATGVTNIIPVSGIPAGAVITSIHVKFNITHGYDRDLILNLKAPNGKVLNLVNQRGANGANFTNTIVSSLGTNAFTNNRANTPFTGTYKPDAALTVGATNNLSNASNFNQLYDILNGNWTFSAKDAIGCESTFFGICTGGNFSGTLNNWSITINYTVSSSPLSVTWSPATDLYTDPGATKNYNGETLSTVYASPASAGTKTYTATVSNSAGCTTTNNVKIIVNPTPVISISAQYCAIPGRVLLTATSVPAATRFEWSNGGTKDTTSVDVAGEYDVTAFTATGCSGTASIDVAQELVSNGDFESGDNVGFTTVYKSHTGSFYVTNNNNSGLYPEGYYAVDTSAFSPKSGVGYHPNFQGKDHTTGHGNFMIVNGSKDLRTIWEQTVPVLPNTTYYFSAWGMNLNPASPARLQFAVNGVQAGTIGELGNAPKPITESDVNTGNWIRFYGTWTSGSTTTSAVINIVNLNTDAGGNDFGLDDISFGTLSTFIYLESAPGTDAQILCANTPLTDIVYNVGNGNSTGPIVKGLPDGITSVFTGSKLTFSGTPAVAGNYTYTITTSGCNPQTATGTITVQSDKISLSSGNASPTICANAPVNIGFKLSGTATDIDPKTVLPAGFTGNLSGGIYTITGTSAIAGIYPYTVYTKGGCSSDSAKGTITLTAQTITLNTANDNQTKCINSSIDNIQYTIGGTGTGANVTGLPAGVISQINSGIVSIFGKPTQAGDFTYTVTSSGTCDPVSITGVIHVTPAAAIALTSANNTQTVCLNSPIAEVVYSLNNATTAQITGLPAGVTGVVSGGILIISGTPGVAGTFTYMVKTTDGCGVDQATGTITVQSQTISLTNGASFPSVCANAPIAPIIYTIGGTATGADVTGLPAGMKGELSGKTFTISGTPTSQGAFTYTINLTGTCVTGVTASGTITVQPEAVGGSLVSLSVCSGDNNSLTLTGQTGTIDHWEISIDGTNWTNLSNNTITQNFINAIAKTWYRVAVKNGCGTKYSTVAAVGIHNLWTGATSSDWNDGSNWSDAQIPSITCPTVEVPVVAINNYPVLSSGPIATIKHLQIDKYASVTINGNTLQISGIITNSGGIFNTSKGTLEFNGTSPQTISGNLFKDSTIGNLILSNTSGLELKGANTNVNILGTVSFTKTTGVITGNDNLVLKSSKDSTASVGFMNAGNDITGNVSVERYVNTGDGGHGKSWQMLAVPTEGQTIRESWMEGATVSNVVSPTPGSLGNPHPGYGTMMTSNLSSGTTFLNGFDIFTAPGPSIKLYNWSKNEYDGPPSTNIAVYDKRGYMILVRGDRSVYTSSAPATPTIMRTKGVLFKPNHQPAPTIVQANHFESIGNPYASSIDLRKITKSKEVDEFVFVWDPKLSGAYGLGAFQALSFSNGNYYPTPGGGSYGDPSSPVNYLQSGQAFFVQTTSGIGTISFTESAKASISNSGTMYLRNGELATPSVNGAQLRSTLYGVNSNGSTFVTDGNLIQYKADYSNKIDGMDARKNPNSSENFAIISGGKTLAIERRSSIVETDTIFYNLTGVVVQRYRMELLASGLSAYGVEGYVEDSYFKTRKPLNMEGTTTVDFTVSNDKGSYAPDRFRVVFKQASPKVVPVTFVSVNGVQKNTDIQVDWKVQNETAILQYEVEKSTDGVRFTKSATVAGTNKGLANYEWMDKGVNAGLYYYRIKTIGKNGEINYTAVVKVVVVFAPPSISIYPNPITDGIIHLQLVNQPAGRYGIRLMNPLGQTIVKKQAEHAGGNGTENIKWDYNLAHGIYQLEIVTPNGGVEVIKVMY